MTFELRPSFRHTIAMLIGILVSGVTHFRRERMWKFPCRLAAWCNSPPRFLKYKW